MTQISAFIEKEAIIEDWDCTHHTFQAFTAGAMMMVEHAGNIMEWWAKDYRFSNQANKWFHRRDGFSQDEDTVYFTTSQLLEEFFKQLNTTKP